MLCNYTEKAKNYVSQLLSKYPSSIDGYLIKGWLELEHNNLKNARNCFRAVLSQVRFDADFFFFFIFIQLYLTNCMCIF